MNPRQMKQMMRQMGMSVDDIDTEEVIIKTSDKEYILINPQVQLMKMKGQETFQIIGDYEIKEKTVQINISEDDIQTVIEQAKVTKEEAQNTLQKTNGDIAEAIIKLTSN